MKKSLLIILSLLLCLSLCSCEKTENPDDTVDEFTYDIQIGGNFLNTPSRVVFQGANKYPYLSYYSKADNLSYILCYNPLCNHESCLASFYKSIDRMAYCNDRLYFLNGEKIYSMNIDGSDIKLELSYGESGDIFDRYSPASILFLNDIGHYGNCIYYRYLNEEEDYELHKYDTQTKTDINLLENYDFEISSYFFGKNIIYFLKRGEPEGYLYSADLNLNNIKRFDNIKNILYLGYFNGKYIFNLKEKTDEDGNTIYSLERIDISTGTVKTLYEDTKNINIEGFNDNYIYIALKDVVILGKSEPMTFPGSIFPDGYDVKNNLGGKLYRLNIEGGEKELIYENLDYEIQSLTVIDNKIFALVSKFSVDDKGYWNVNSTSAVMVLDENGMVTGIEELVPIK